MIYNVYYLFWKINPVFDIYLVNFRKRLDIQVWMSFSDVRKFVHTLNLESTNDWKKFINNELEIKRPKNMPKSPQFVYKELGWLNWRDWFGKV